MSMVLRVLFIFMIVTMNTPASYAAELLTDVDVDVHAFASQGYLKSTHNDYLAKTSKGSFGYDEVGINISSDLTDKLRLGAQLLSRDLGDVGNNKTELDWGYGDYHWRDWLGFRTGKVKIPQGLQNEGRDIDALRTFILLPQGIYDENKRDFINALTGFGVYGIVPAGPMGSFEYKDVYGTRDVETGNPMVLNYMQAAAGALSSRTDIDSSDLENRYTNVAALVWNTPLEGLRLGVSELNGKLIIDAEPESGSAVGSIPLEPYRITVNQTSYVIYSMEYQRGNLDLMGEYSLHRMELSYAIPHIPTEPWNNTIEAWYAQATYRFADWLEAGTYYSVYYPNRSNKSGAEQSAGPAKKDFQSWQKDICLALRFDINQYLILKLEVHRMDGAAQVVDCSSIDDLERRWNLFAVKTTVCF